MVLWCTDYRQKTNSSVASSMVIANGGSFINVRVQILLTFFEIHALETL